MNSALTKQKLGSCHGSCPPAGLKEPLSQTVREGWLQGSSVRCFAANPSALIAVSPLRPQSQQRVVVQNL